MKTIRNELEKIKLPESLTKRDIIIFDIETTGFSREFHQIILIGAILINDHKITFHQWFNDDGQSEKEIIESWKTLLDHHRHSLLISYNGDAFDVPFINARCQHHQLSSNLHKSLCLDVYRAVRRRYQDLDGVENYKLKSIEKYLGIHREDKISGKESIALYLEYLSTKDPELERKILLHNDEDIRLMLPLLNIVNHIDITKDLPITFSYERENYYVKFSKISKSALLLSGEFTDQFPLQFHQGKFSLIAMNGQIDISIPFIQHKEYIIADTISLFGKSFNTLSGDSKASMVLGIKETLQLENIKTLIKRVIEKRWQDL